MELYELKDEIMKIVCLSKVNYFINTVNQIFRIII